MKLTLQGQRVNPAHENCAVCVYHRNEDNRKRATLRSARIMNLTKKAYGVWAMGYTPTREFHTMDRWVNASLYSDARHNANQDRAAEYTMMALGYRGDDAQESIIKYLVRNYLLESDLMLNPMTCSECGWEYSNEPTRYDMIHDATCEFANPID